MPKTWDRLLEQLRCPLGRLVEIGVVRNSEGGMARFRYLRRFALILITRGEGIYEDEMGRQRSLVAGDWVLVLPELGHSYRPLVAGGWDEFYVMFEGPLFELWRERGMLGTDHVAGHLHGIDQWVDRLRREVVESDRSATSRICAFQHFLAEVLEEGGGDWSSAPSGPGWFAEACRLLSRPGAEGKRVAATLELNYETFRRRFREHAGMPPHRYHRQQLINRAARLLETTDMKSADIASSLGFCDEPYFSRVFKKITGRSPSDYRRSR